MSNVFMNLSFPFLMDLFSIKRKAEKRGDISTVEQLKLHYPELFTNEFQEFIDNVKHVAKGLDNRYGENFSSYFEDEITNENKHLH